MVSLKQQIQSSRASEVKRTAEALFESKTISEIREVGSMFLNNSSIRSSSCALLSNYYDPQIEKKTRRDVDLKKQQLKQLVGDSYRRVDLSIRTDSTCSACLKACDSKRTFNMTGTSSKALTQLLQSQRSVAASSPM